MSTGDNAITLRQFRYLQTRSLLHLQDELRVLERDLFRLDERDARDRPHHLTSRETAAEEDGGGRSLCGVYGGSGPSMVRLPPSNPSRPAQDKDGGMAASN